MPRTGGNTGYGQAHHKSMAYLELTLFRRAARIALHERRSMASLLAYAVDQYVLSQEKELSQERLMELDALIEAMFNDE